MVAGEASFHDALLHESSRATVADGAGTPSSHDASLHESSRAGVEGDGHGRASWAPEVVAGHEMAAGMPALQAPPPSSGLLSESGATVGSPSVIQLAESKDESLLESSRQHSNGMDP